MIRKFALVFGIIYVIAGVMGFIPGIVQPAHDAPPLAVEAGHGRLLGLFTINVLHNLVHILIGVWGILGLLAILGLIPATNTLFGLVPIHDHDVWLHAGSAAIAAYFGFVAPATDTDRTAPSPS